MDSRTIFHILPENLQIATATAPATPVAAAVPAAVRVERETPDAAEEAFTPGQRVTILAPPALAGKEGEIVASAAGDNFAVQLASGSIFHISSENLQDVSCSSPEAKRLAFTPGQRVNILAPAALAGKQGDIIAPAAGGIIYAVQLDSYSRVHVMAENLQDSAVAPPPAAAASRAPAAAASGSDEELLFQPGQRVTLNGPPAMAGKQGTVIGPIQDDAFAIQFDTGSIFNIAICNIEGSGIAAQPAAPAAVPPPSDRAPAATAGFASVSSDDEELLFQPGQRVTLIGPPAMAGKQGTVIGPAQDDAFAIQFDTGSIFNIAVYNIEGSGIAAPPTESAKPSAAAAVSTEATGLVGAWASAAESTISSGDEFEFQPGEKVQITAPAAMSGKRGEIIAPAPGNSFQVMLESGSIFYIEAVNIQTLAKVLA
jgi:hypothetical protein